MLNEEGLWRAACESEWSLSKCCTPDPQRRPLLHFKEAYGAWHASFGRYGPLAPRALRVWRQIEDWTRQHCPEVADSLR